MFKRVKLKESVLKRIVNQIVSQSVTKVPLIAINAYTKYFAGEIVERAREVQQEYAEAHDRILEEKWRQHYEEEREKKQKGSKTLTNGTQSTPNANGNTMGNNNAGSPNIKTEQSNSPPATAPDAASPEVDSVVTANTERPKDSEQPRHDSSRSPSPPPSLSTRKLPPPSHPSTSLSGFENPHRGGLLPDHLREALRRYKQDGEGGGVGFDGSSAPGLGTRGRQSWKVGGTFGGGGRRLFK